jgi:hypothetical protein
LSHEIRTPISITKSSITYALDSLKKSKQQQAVSNEIIEFLEDGLHACEGTVTILNDMLSYESMEAGKYKLYQEFVPVVATVKSLVNNIKSAGVDKRIKFEMENQLQESESELFCYFDVPKIEQVFRNLATNSVKFSGSDSIIKVIIRKVNNSPEFDSVAAAKPDEFEDFQFAGLISISFTDSGVGIATENVKKVFGEFSQFDPNTLQGGGGAGLGLHITRNIVFCHGGTIQVSSEGIGLGTSITMSFNSYARDAPGRDISLKDSERSNNGFTSQDELG